jgi:heme exporter protein B
MLKNISIIIKQDIKLALRQSSGVVNTLGFFIISSALFAFAMGPDPENLKIIGLSVIWVCALLASLLSIKNIFQQDYEDGTLAQIYLQGVLLESLVIGKLISHWLISALPIIFITPLIAILFNIEEMIIALLLSLLAGTPTICVIGAFGSGLTLAVKNGTILSAVIILPLYIPILIFGVTAANGSLSMLFAILLLLVPIFTFATSSALKYALED